jgi:hypothetical protein
MTRKRTRSVILEWFARTPALGFWIRPQNVVARADAWSGALQRLDGGRADPAGNFAGRQRLVGRWDRGALDTRSAYSLQWN